MKTRPEILKVRRLRKEISSAKLLVPTTDEAQRTVRMYLLEREQELKESIAALNEQYSK